MYQISNLIERRKGRGYPTDYVTARVRGRSCHLLQDWDALLHSPRPADYIPAPADGQPSGLTTGDDAWTRLLREYRWVYYRMNDQLQEAFRPYFLTMEIKTLLSCFRFLSRQQGNEGIKNLLAFSLLNSSVRTSLSRASDLSSFLIPFEKHWLPQPRKSDSLRTLFREKGLPALEQKLTALILHKIVAMPLDTVMRIFLTALIDFKNILAVLRHQKWELSDQPPFISGGSIGALLLIRSFRTGDSSLLQSAASRAGLRITELTPVRAETDLLVGISRKMRLLKRENEDRGIMLSYLWDCYVEAENLGMILHGEHVDRDSLKEELVRP